MEISKPHLEAIEGASIAIGIDKLIHVEKKNLIGEISRVLEKHKTQEWIKLLEYKPGSDLRKHPFIPIRFKNAKIYTIMFWLFAPLSSFFDAWVSPLMIDPKCKTAGKIGQIYGKAFEGYVNAKLEKLYVFSWLTST